MVKPMETKIPDPKFAEEVIRQGGNTLNLCIQCGTCTASCPSGRLTAFRIRKIYRMAQLGLKDDVLSSEELWHCTTCYNCYERCPRGVKTVDIVFTLRNMAVKAGFMAKAHRIGAGYLLKYGHLVPINSEIKEARKTLKLPEMPPTVQSDTEGLKEIMPILEATGFHKLAEVK